MTTSASGSFAIGQRVRVTQQVPRLGNAGETISTSVEGIITSSGQSKTGSWYAHSKDHKLWIERLQLRKDDGEVVHVNLDQFTSVECL